jgi:hypothetical protein
MKGSESMRDAPMWRAATESPLWLAVGGLSAATLASEEKRPLGGKLSRRTPQEPPANAGNLPNKANRADRGGLEVSGHFLPNKPKSPAGAGPIMTLRNKAKSDVKSCYIVCYAASAGSASSPSGTLPTAAALLRYRAKHPNWGDKAWAGLYQTNPIRRSRRGGKRPVRNKANGPDTGVFQPEGLNRRRGKKEKKKKKKKRKKKKKKKNTGGTPVVHMGKMPMLRTNPSFPSWRRP